MKTFFVIGVHGRKSVLVLAVITADYLEFVTPDIVCCDDDNARGVRRLCFQNKNRFLYELRLYFEKTLRNYYLIFF